MTEDEIKTVVRHAVPEVLQTFGVDVQDPPAAQADMAYVRRRREFEEKFSAKSRMVIMTSLLSTAVIGIVYLIRDAITGAGGN